MISKQNVPPFVWREVCAGWRLVDADDLQVIQEQMPPGTSELLHVHARATQVYYVLAGRATVDLGASVETLGAQEAVLIEPGTPHRIANHGEEPLQFLVISSAPTREDREDLE